MVGTSISGSPRSRLVHLFLVNVIGIVFLTGCIDPNIGFGAVERTATLNVRTIEIGGFLFSYEEEGSDPLLLSRARKCRERLDGGVNSQFTHDLLTAPSSAENSRSIFMMIVSTSNNNLEIRKVFIAKDSGKWERLTNEQISTAVFGGNFDGNEFGIETTKGELDPKDVSQLMVPISSLALAPHKLQTPTTKQKCFFVRIMEGEESLNVLTMSETEQVSLQNTHSQAYENFLHNVLSLTQ